eukprot:5879357-Pyramimonas_sp.AAC.1
MTRNAPRRPRPPSTKDCTERAQATPPPRPRTPGETASRIQEEEPPSRKLSPSGSRNRCRPT